tara:strand:- start:335 stop:466 length:132 start_codon:yes stop_codon:yes gene_type:complete
MCFEFSLKISEIFRKKKKIIFSPQENNLLVIFFENIPEEHKVK